MQQIKLFPSTQPTQTMQSVKDIKRPPLKWLGSKWRLSSWIIGQMPMHDIFIEPFGGSASVLLRKPRAKHELYNDINNDLFNLFQVLKDKEQCRELYRLIKFTPYSRAELIHAAKQINETNPVKRAFDFLIISHFSFNVMRNYLNRDNAKQTASFNLGISKTAAHLCKTDNHGWANFRGEIPRICKRLQGVTIENKNALDVVEYFADNPDALIFIDPPYYEATECRRVSYGFEFNKDDHQNLLNLITKARARIMLTTYDNELYKTALQGWNVESYLNNSRHSNTKNKKRVELLYKNF